MAGVEGFASAAKAAAKQKAVSAAKDAGKNAAKDVGRSMVTDDPMKSAPRGAGGTSAQAPSPVAGMTQQLAKDHAKKAAAGAAVSAAPAVGKIALLMMFLNWLKSLFAAIAAALANLWGMFVAFLLGVVKAIAGFFVGIGTAVAGFVGGAISAGAAAVGSFVLVVLTVIGVGAGAAGAVQANSLIRHDAMLPDCSVEFDEMVFNSGGGFVDAGAETTANAQLIYGVLKAWGMGDENIAGILGNWDAESGIDPTGVETIFDERFHMGPRKLDAQAKGFKIKLVNPSYAATYPAIDLMGIGLGQWTNGRNTLLTDYAHSIGQPWYMLETQLGFMISKDDPWRVGQIEQMVANTNPGAGSVDGATEFFMTKWEGLSLGVGNLATRKSRASSWYAQMGGWEANAELANSILAQSGVALDGADGAALREAMNKCISQKLDVDNSTLATAAVSYAWPYKEDSRRNDGTYMYVWLHEQIFPGDPYFASCDRSAATGVRWSGTDNTFPAGAVQQQINYVQTSSKWAQVPWGGDESLLQPGDLLIRKDPSVSHIITYVGKEVPTQVWGVGAHEPDANIMHGSLSSHNGRSPGLDRTYSGSQGTQTYTAWRSTGPEASPQYSSLVPPADMIPGTGDKSRYTTPSP